MELSELEQAELNKLPSGWYRYVISWWSKEFGIHGIDSADDTSSVEARSAQEAVARADWIPSTAKRIVVTFMEFD